MSKCIARVALALGLAMMVSTVVVAMEPEGEPFDCVYELDTGGEENGQAMVGIAEEGIVLRIRGGFPNSLYTVWVDFKSRETGELPADYPDVAESRGVTPAFASVAAATEGMGLDPNGVVTDANGDANATLVLDYSILAADDTPVVYKELSMQGMNRVGGTWARQYPNDPEIEASLQMTSDGLPLLVRSTPAGITIVRHPDKVTHGHTPGVGDVDHFSAFKGDFPAECLSDR